MLYMYMGLLHYGRGDYIPRYGATIILGPPTRTAQIVAENDRFGVAVFHDDRWVGLDRFAG